MSSLSQYLPSSRRCITSTRERRVRCLSRSCEFFEPLTSRMDLPLTAVMDHSIGSLLGITTDRYQEVLYRYADALSTCCLTDSSLWHRRNVGTRGPEARLYHAMFAAILFPIAMFIYAWCTFSNVHWISLVIAITVRWPTIHRRLSLILGIPQLFIWACFGIYLTVFTYLADWCVSSSVPCVLA